MQKQSGNIILIILIWFSSFTLLGQQNNNYYPNFSSVPGLPTKIATSVFKDSKGFMWFGAENGLYRWDGYDYKIFKYDPMDSTSISGNMISKILIEDATGNLWISTKASGLNIYNPHIEIFTRIDEKSGYDFSFNLITQALQDKNGIVWLSSRSETGIIKFDRKAEECLIYRPNRDTLESFGNQITGFIDIGDGNLLVGTYHGLNFFNKNDKNFSPFDSAIDIPDAFNNAIISGFIKDADNIIWMGSRKGIFEYNIIEKKVIHHPFDKGLLLDSQNLKIRHSVFIGGIYENPTDGGKSLWLVSEVGLYKFEKSSRKITKLYGDLNDPLNLAFSSMFNTIFDENGILWATSGFGAVTFNLNTNPFSEYTIGPFENDPYLTEATTFLEDKSGNFWVGTGYNGLLKYDQNMNLLKRYNYNSNNPNGISYHLVFSLFEDSDSILWVGTAVNLDVFDKKNNRFIHCSLPAEHVYNFIRINDIYQDSHKILWLGTSEGIYFQEKQEDLDSSFLKVPGFIGRDKEVRSIEEDSLGNLWFASNGSGLYLLTPENRKSMTFKNYKHDPDNPQSICDDVIWSTYIDENNILWLGTSNGLNRFEYTNKQSSYFNQENGLDANFIYYIEGDNQGYLWLSTEKGIIQFNQLTDSTAHSKLLGKADGVPFENNYQFKFYKGNDGKLYVGGQRFSGNGFYCFHPDSLKENTHMPEIVLTELLVNNNLHNTDSNITIIKHLNLKYDENFFSIKFAALDYVNPTKNEYAYMLEGFDKDWIYSNNRRLANYTNVPVGNYVFRAKGSNNDGLWNEKGISLKITISPPPWKTWWAYLLYGFFIATILYFIFRYYFKRQQLLHKLALEKVQTEKLEELDRTKSRFFANISHEFRTPLTLILGPMEKLRDHISDGARKDLDMMQRNAKRLQNLINQLLSLSKLESGKMKLQAGEMNIVLLVKRYSQSFESLAKQKKIQYQFKSSEEDIPVFVDKDKIEKILYNLISNAFKFTSERGKVNVSITQLESEVRIKVFDSGNGISSDQLPHIFDRFYQSDDNFSKDQEGTGIGLALAKELVELHHGRITAESNPDSYREDAGTTFTVFLPIGKEHLKSVEIIQTVESVDLEDRSDQIIEIQDQDTDIIDNTLEDDSKPLILIVEDNDDLRSYIRSYLTDDYLITEAIDGEMGVKKAIDKIPDLIVSDVMMPKMDGYGLCNKLKADERTSHIPVILLTAKAAREDKLEGLETGADDFLSKPFDSEELLVRINNLISQREKLKEKYISWLKPKIEKEKEKILSLDDKFLIKAQQVVEQNISDPEFSVEYFAKEMAISRVQLHRKLKALINQSGGEFIRILRLNKAADLLLQRTGNISETAWDVGFNDPNYFTTSFSKHFGMTPSKYLAKNSKS